MGYEYPDYVRRIAANDLEIRDIDTNLRISRFKRISAGEFAMYGGETTGDDLKVYANSADSYPYFDLTGNADFVVATKNYMYFNKNGTYFFQFDVSGGDSIIDSQANNQNIFLRPDGTGKVKFGSHTATGDVACNGNIQILDAAGNTRKLMTTA